MAKVTERDDTIRDRWRRFLSPLLDDVPIAKLAQAMKELTGGTGDLRGEIYAYRDGTQTPGTARAFLIGEALSGLGVEWSSGPIALYAAGHLDAFLRVVGNLASDSEWRDVAGAIAMLAPLAVDEGDYRDAAREVLGAYASGVDGFRWAFERESHRSWDDALIAAEALASAPVDLKILEPSVVSLLRGWARSAVSTELRELLVDPIISAFEERSKARDSLISRIMSDLDVDEMRPQTEPKKAAHARRGAAKNGGKPARRKPR